MLRSHAWSCVWQVIAAFLYLMYSYMGISVSKNIIPDEIEGRVIHNSFPLTLFVVSSLASSSVCLLLLCRLVEVNKVSSVCGSVEQERAFFCFRICF